MHLKPLTALVTGLILEDCCWQHNTIGCFNIDVLVSKTVHAIVLNGAKRFMNILALLTQFFAIYMDDLSVCLTQCKAGCHLNETE